MTSNGLVKSKQLPSLIMFAVFFNKINKKGMKGGGGNLGNMSRDAIVMVKLQ